MAWNEDYKPELLKAGFSESDTQNIAYGIAQNLQKAGATPDQFETVFGKPVQPDPGNMAEVMNQSLRRNMPVGPSETPPDHNTLAEAAKGAWQSSVLGTAARGGAPAEAGIEKPSLFDEDTIADTALRAAQGIGTAALDLPLNVAGGLIGSPGGPAGAAAGAFALPQAMREAMMQSYKSGGIHSAKDFTDMADAGFMGAVKGAATGAVVAATGGGTAALTAGLNPLIAGAAAIGTETTAMTGFSAAMEGKLPDPKDFVDNAIMIGGMHGAGHVLSSPSVGGEAHPDVQAKLQQTFADTGLHPQEVAARAMADPVLKQQMLSIDPDTPRALQNEMEPTIKSDFVVKDNKLIPGDKPEAQSEFDFGKTTLDDIKADSELRLSMDKREESARLHDPQAFRALESMSRDVKNGEDSIANNNETLEALKPSEKSLAQLESVREQLKQKDLSDEDRRGLQEKESQLSNNESGLRDDAAKAQQLREQNAGADDRLNRVALGAKLKPRLLNAWEQGQKTLESNLKDRINNKTIEVPNDPAATPLPGFNPDYTDKSEVTPQLTKAGKEFHTSDEAMGDYYGSEKRNLSEDEILSHLLRNHPELAKRIAPEIVFEKQIEDAEGNVGKSTISIGPKTPRAPEPLSMAGIERDYFNNLQRVEAIEKQTSKSLGRPLTPSESPAAKILNARASARQIADWLGKPGENADSAYGVVNQETGEKYSDSRAKIIDDSGLDYKNNEQMDTLRKYRMYREIIDENAAGRSTGVPDIEARSFIEDNKEKYEKAAAGLTNWHNSISQLLADKGIFTQESVDATRDAHPNYVPLSRLTPEMKSKSGFDPNSIMKNREGSELPFVDPAQSDFDKARNAARIISRNDAIKALVKLNDLQPEGQNLFKVDEGSNGPADMGKILDSDPTLDKPLVSEKDLDKGQIAYMDKGESKTISFADEDLKNAMETMDFNPGAANAVSQYLGPIDKLAKGASQATRIAATSSLDFTLRHLIRDEVNTTLVNKELRIPFVNTIAKLGDALGKKSNLYVEANRNGALNGVMADIDAMVGNKFYAMQDDAGAWSTAKNIIKSPWQLSHSIMQVMGEAKRLSIYDVKVKALGDNPTSEQLQQAGQETMESSINGLRIGAKMQGMVSYAAFMHYDTQGTYQSLKTLKDNPQRAAIGGALLTAASVAAWAANHDDPDYQAIPDYEKDTYLHFKVGGNYIKVPLPWTMGLAFSAIPRRLLDFAQKQDSDSAMKIGQTFLSVSPFNPFELRKSIDKVSLVGMIDGFVNNYNSMSGKDIIPDSMLRGRDKVSPEEQVKSYTSNTAIAVSHLFNYNGAISTLAHQVHLDSPIMVDHAIQTFLGTPGQTAMRAVELSLQKAGMQMPNPVPPPQLNDIPFVGALQSRQPMYNSQTIQDFNEKFEKLDALNNTAKDLQKSGKDDEANDFVAKHPELENYDDMKETHETLRGQNILIQSFQKDKTLTPSDRKRLTEEAFKNSSVIAKTKLDELNQRPQNK